MLCVCSWHGTWVWWPCLCNLLVIIIELLQATISVADVIFLLSLSHLLIFITFLCFMCDDDGACGRWICCRRFYVDCSRSLSLAFHVGVKLSSSLESHRWHLAPRTSLNRRVVCTPLLPFLLPSVTVHRLCVARSRHSPSLLKTAVFWVYTFLSDLKCYNHT